jgi:hypothetical protein
LNRGAQHRKHYNRDKRSLTRRNHLTVRSEITSLYSQPKQAAVTERCATDASERIAWRKQLMQHAPRASVQVGVEPGKSNQKKLVCRFLSWCFPPRGFASPLQRVLYLSMEGPRRKARSRVRFR